MTQESDIMPDLVLLPSMKEQRFSQPKLKLYGLYHAVIAQTLPNWCMKPHHRGQCKIHQRNVKQPRHQPLSQYKLMDPCNSHVLLYSRTCSWKSSHQMNYQEGTLNQVIKKNQKTTLKIGLTMLTDSYISSTLTPPTLN